MYPYCTRIVREFVKRASNNVPLARKLHTVLDPFATHSRNISPDPCADAEPELNSTVPAGPACILITGWAGKERKGLAGDSRLSGRKSH